MTTIMKEGKTYQITLMCLKGKKEPPLLSAIQVKKAIRQKEEIFLLTIKQEGQESIQEINSKASDLIKEFTDIFLDQMPKKLPPP